MDFEHDESMGQRALDPDLGWWLGLCFGFSGNPEKIKKSRLREWFSWTSVESFPWFLPYHLSTLFYDLTYDVIQSSLEASILTRNQVQKREIHDRRKNCICIKERRPFLIKLEEKSRLTSASKNLSEPLNWPFYDLCKIFPGTFLYSCLHQINPVLTNNIWIPSLKSSLQCKFP